MFRARVLTRSVHCLTSFAQIDGEHPDLLALPLHIDKSVAVKQHLMKLRMKVNQF
jgi:hypothetical protein